MARPRKATTSPVVDEPQVVTDHVPDAVESIVESPAPAEIGPIVLGDSIVDVVYFDNSKFTFDLYFAGKRISFVDGVAHVAPELALALREGGYVA